MTTIILTIIGILLAAAAALMVIFYGGDAFNGGSIGAQANTYQNAGTNVISAVQLAKTDAADVSTVAKLITGKYLKETPSLPSTASASDDLSTGFYTVTGVDPKVCAKVNVNLKHAVSTTVGEFKMGCVETSNTFYATV